MPTRGEAGEVGRREEAALADHDAVARDARREPLADRERGLEGAQVAVVDADQPRLQLQRALELIFVVHFDQHVHAIVRTRHLRSSRAAASSTAAMMIRMQSAPQRARFRHLIGLEHEILAQRRQRRGRARRGRGIPAGPGTTARRSAPRGRRRRPPHRPRERGRIEIGADQALRRARLLDLGDQRVVAGRDACARSPRGSRAAAAAAFASASSVGERLRALRRGDLLALVGFDLGRGCRSSGSRRSRPRSAGRAGLRPRRCRSTLAASATPSFRSLALPATISAAAALSSATSRNAPLLALEHVEQRRGIVLGIAAAQRLRLRRAASPTSSGVISKVAHLAVLQRRDAGRAGRGDLVEPVGAVHHPDAFGAEILRAPAPAARPIAARTRRPSAA